LTPDRPRQDPKPERYCIHAGLHIPHPDPTAAPAHPDAPTKEDWMTKEPTRSRAVFSTEDFGLMKEAVADYIRKVADEPRSVKFANLYHRLGRLG
jgi:hypothetical protein